MNDLQVKSERALKPCPFCGGEVEGPFNETAGSSRDNKWRISCNNWCVSMYRKRKKEVIKDWNQRPNDLTEDARGASELMRLVRLLSEPGTKEAINSFIELMNKSFADSPGFSVYDRSNFLLAEVTEHEQRRLIELLEILRDAT